MDKTMTKSQLTREKLLNSALELFSSSWYETVSISEISRHAGKSSGSFYNYFKSKEDIFLILLNDFLLIFENQMEGISGETVEERLESFIFITINTGKKYKNMVTVFREGQYRYIEMEKKLRTVYVTALKAVFGRTLNELEYLFVTAPIRFVSIRNLYHRKSYQTNTLKTMILNGLYFHDSFNVSKVFTSFSAISKNEEQTTKNVLLSNAIDLFGKDGYYKVNVHDITRKSGFAVGTFYRHFKSKEQILHELVEQIGSDIRMVIRENRTENLNTLEQTVQGFYLFLKFMEKHPAYYTIIREAEFVLEESVEEYYNRFEIGYLKQLCPKSLDPVTVANALSGMGHYFGIEDIFSRNIRDIENSLKVFSTYLESGIPLKGD
jgi:AcrR family transcriptional regulator